MVLMDELPVNSLLDGAGAVDATLFPNLAALSRDSTWYRNDTTVADDTLRSVPAIDSGLLPKKSNAMAISGEYPKSVFTLLGGSYRMNVHEGGEALCPLNACPRSSWRSLSDAQGLCGLVNDAWPIWTDFASPVRTSAPSLCGTLKRNALRNAEDFVHSLQPARKPTFDYLHFLLPHQPWHYDADGRSGETGPFPSTESGPAVRARCWASNGICCRPRLRTG